VCNKTYIAPLSKEVSNVPVSSLVDIKGDVFDVEGVVDVEGIVVAAGMVAVDGIVDEDGIGSSLSDMTITSFFSSPEAMSSLSCDHSSLDDLDRDKGLNFFFFGRFCFLPPKAKKMKCWYCVFDSVLQIVSTNLVDRRATKTWILIARPEIL